MTSGSFRSVSRPRNRRKSQSARLRVLASQSEVALDRSETFLRNQDPQQTLLPRRTGILPFRFRLPLTRQLLRFGDLCRGHLPRDAISIADRILVTSRSRQAEPHVCVNIVLRHA